MNWSQVEALSGQTLRTITGKRFQVVRVTPGMVYISPGGKMTEHSISRANLERAADLIAGGTNLNGPAEYREQVADERPTYAWAILRELGDAT